MVLGAAAFTCDVHLLVLRVRTKDEPPTTVHLDPLGTWRLITGVLKCSCLVSQQRFVRTALGGTALHFHTFGGQPNHAQDTQLHVQ